MWTNLLFFGAIFGVEMWDRVRNSTPNFKTTLHKVFGNCFRNKWACSLAVGLFSHCWIHLCRSKVCNAMASGRNMCHPAPDSLLRKGKRGCVHAMEVVHIQEWQQENRRACVRSARLTFLGCLETWNCSLWELCVKLLT